MVERSSRSIQARLMLLLALSCALPARAQKEIITITNWRIHAGDNPGWAEPHSDGSRWGKVGYREFKSFFDAGGTRWYRATFRVPAGFADQKLASGIGPLEQVYEVYLVARAPRLEAVTAY